MTSADESPPGGESGSDANVRAEALEVVSDALQWRLADARWQAIEQVLVAMDTAVESSDMEALLAATADLELMGPLRITRIGDIPAVPPVPPVRDRLNRLVHSLGDPSEMWPDGPDEAGVDDDNAPHN